MNEPCDRLSQFHSPSLRINISKFFALMADIAKAITIHADCEYEFCNERMPKLEMRMREFIIRITMVVSV